MFKVFKLITQHKYRNKSETKRKSMGYDVNMARVPLALKFLLKVQPCKIKSHW